MSHLFRNTIKSVVKAPVILQLLPIAQMGWCQQLSEEGYDVVRVEYPRDTTLQFREDLIMAQRDLDDLDSDWALMTYGLSGDDMSHVEAILDFKNLKACIHFCPSVTDAERLFLKDDKGLHIHSLFHLASSQETLHAYFLSLCDSSAVGHTAPASSVSHFAFYTYPLVPSSPPFPFLMKAPALVTARETSTTDPHVRSATNVSYTRTLELLRKQLGPHFNLEELWEKHTFYEFVERDAAKTMSTMVSAPYVNHVATMTGGVGYKELARFYKYHFVNVTPPDAEMITVSRTVGTDRIIDEMIFKCTHTTEFDYFLPGVKPTGKHLEIAMVGVVAFRGDKLTFEHLYWDQASVLVQLGLLDPTGLPVAGVEVAKKVMDPFVLPNNALLPRWKESEGLSID